MATTITSDCIMCGFCVLECPNGAISEGHYSFRIDPARCTECVGFFDVEACQAICPVRCCLPDPDRREDEPELIRRAMALHPEDEALHRRFESGKFPSLFRRAESKGA